MSNFLAPATVTAALALLLEERIAADIADFDFNVLALRPDEVNDDSRAHVNVFLYQVTPNPHWRNADLPTRNGRGQLQQRPRAALDLHYLFTFFGDEGELQPQRLLGSTTHILHAQPVLTRSWIDNARNSSTYPFLSGSDLGNEIERVKFTPQPFSLEELSKLWSIFFQTRYSLSVAYLASVVFVEPQEAAAQTLPVQTRVVNAIPSVTLETPPTPDRLESLQLWLRSDEGLTYDADGVSEWQDQSGNQHHAIQDDVAQRPRLVAHAIGRFPALRFDGSDDRLAIDWQLGGTSDGWTVAAVVRTTNNNVQAVVSFDGDRYWELRASNGPAAPRVVWQTADSTHSLHLLSADRPFDDRQWHVLLAQFSAGAAPDKQLFVDGIAVGTADAHGGNALGSGPNRFGFVGAASNAATLDGAVADRFLNGDVAEIVIYDRALTDGERDGLERYFADRYGKA